MKLLSCVAWVGLCLGSALSGCARINDTGMRLVSTKVDAFLLVNDQWLAGDVLLIPDRTGRVSFSADKGSVNRCSGGLRYTGTHTAEADVYCNDGTRLSLPLSLQGETRGYGQSLTAQGPVGLAFGWDEDEALALMGRATPATPESPAPTP